MCKPTLGGRELDRGQGKGEERRKTHVDPAKESVQERKDPEKSPAIELPKHPSPRLTISPAIEAKDDSLQTRLSLPVAHHITRLELKQIRNQN